MVTFSKLVLPAETNRSPLAGKLIIFKRRKLKFLNLLDKFVLFGF